MTLNISEHYQEIEKKTSQLSTCLTTLSEYWQSIEKYMGNEEENIKSRVSSDYLYLRNAFSSYSASLSKPVEQVKLGIHQLFKNTWKKLEPIGHVFFIKGRCSGFETI